MITRLIWTLWTPMSSVPKKADTLNLSLSTKSGPIATKRKANIVIQLQASNVTNGFDLGHDLDIWIFKVKCDLDHLVTKVRCKDLPDSDRGDFRCRRAVNSSSSIKTRAFGSRTSYRVRGLAGDVMHAWLSHSSVNHWICNFKASLLSC